VNTSAPFLCLLTAALLSGCLDHAVRDGRNALGQGRYEDAIRFFDDAVTRLPTPKRPLSDLASAHRALAGVLIQRGDCAGASEHIRRADALSTPLLIDHQGLFRCLETAKAPPEVRQKVMERLVALGESRGPILRELVVAFLDQRRHDDAMKYAPAARARFALQTEDYRRLGFVFATAGRHDQAVSYLHQFMRSTPTDPLARLKLATSLEALGKHVSARQMYTSLTSDFPKNPVIYLRLAAYCTRQRDTYCADDARRTANELRGIQRQNRSLRPLLKSKR